MIIVPSQDYSNNKILSYVYLVDAPPRMPKIASCALLPASYYTNTPFKEQLKVLVQVILILVLLLLDEGLKLYKELLDRVKVQRIQQQVQKFYAYFGVHLFDPLSIVERGIVHYKYRIRLQVRSIIVEQLFDIVLKEGTISRSLKHAKEEHPILYICRKDLIPLLTLISSYLDRCRPKRRLACPSKTNPFITSRLIYIYELIGAKCRQLVHIVVLEVYIASLSYLTARFLRLTSHLQGSTNRRCRYRHFELVQQEQYYFIKVLVRLFEEMFEEGIEH